MTVSLRRFTEALANSPRPWSTILLGGDLCNTFKQESVSSAGGEFYAIVFHDDDPKSLCNLVTYHLEERCTLEPSL